MGIKFVPALASHESSGQQVCFGHVDLAVNEKSPIQVVDHSLYLTTLDYLPDLTGNIKGDSLNMSNYF